VSCSSALQILCYRQLVTCSATAAGAVCKVESSTSVCRSPDRFIDYDWLWFLFRHISPYFWAALGVALAVGMSILGAAWSVDEHLGFHKSWPLHS
jgi:hypothetical protein